MEALTRELSGEDINFSEQYFVDCTFTYSGCAGGTVNQGYKLTQMRQFLLSEETFPYSADCESMLTMSLTLWLRLVEVYNWNRDVKIVLAVSLFLKLARFTKNNTIPDQACQFTDDINTFTNNAMTKIWVQEWIPITQEEDAVLGQLVSVSPIAFGLYISDNLIAYSGGYFDFQRIMLI